MAETPDAPTREELIGMLRELEWTQRMVDGARWYFCPSCRRWKKIGHADDCRLAALLRRTEGRDDG